MKTREQIVDALREILKNYDDPTLQPMEQFNLDAGVVAMMWVIEEDQMFVERAKNGEDLGHTVVRYRLTEFLIDEGGRYDVPGTPE